MSSDLGRPGASEARWGRVALLGSTLLLLGLIATSAVIAGRLGYFPAADEAVHGVRADDVLRSNSPLLGMPSSTDRLVGVGSHHPGPLAFWAYAIPVRLFGYGAGLLIGVVLVNGLATVGIAVVTNRRIGPWLASVAVALTTVAYLSLSPAILYRPLNGAIPVLPFLCFLVLTWAVIDRDRRLLPLLALAGSFVLQAHLGFGILVGVLVALVIAVLAGQSWAGRRSRTSVRVPGRSRPLDGGTLAFASTWAVVVACCLAVASAAPSSASAVILAVASAVAVVVLIGPHRWATVWQWLQTTSGRTLALTGLALAVAWSAPAGDAAVNAGGNARALVRVATTDVATFGLPYARAALRTMTRPPLPARHYGPNDLTAPWSRPALLLVVVFGVVLGLAWHRADPTARRLAMVAIAALAAGAFSASRIPLASGYQTFSTIWLVPIQAFTWLAVVGLLVRALPSGDVGQRRATGVAALIASLAVVLALPHVVWPAEDHGDNWHYEAIATLGPAAVRATTGDNGPYLVAAGGGPRMRDFSRTLLAFLESEGVATRTRTLVPDFGAGRAFDPLAPEDIGTFWVLAAGTTEPPPGATRVAAWEPDGERRDRADQLARDVQAFLDESGPLHLDGEQAFQIRHMLYGLVPGLCPPEGSPPPGCDPGDDLEDQANRLLATRPELALALYVEGLVTAPALPPDLAARLAGLTAVGVEVWFVPSP